MKTTDPQDELFPIVDEQDKVIGKITRNKAHKSPNIIHRASHVLIIDSQGRLLIQKRSLTKDTAPGYWMDSVGGHVGYGEEYLNVAVKEIQEELGIKILPVNLKLLGKILIEAPWEKEMTQVYEYVIKDNLSFNPNREEISEIKFVDKKTLEKILTKENFTPSSLQIIPKFFL